MGQFHQLFRKKFSKLHPAFVFCFAGAILLCYFCWVNALPKWKQNVERELAIRQASPAFVLPREDTPAQETAYYERRYATDVLSVPEERRSYSSGSMVLRIPELACEAAVMDGTTAEALKKGPGLYEQSPLPSRGNPNVCIAGHRGVYGAEFYHLDLLRPGSQIFLEYNGFRFTYEFAESKVVEETDWSMIYCGEESSVTLTTCHPLSTSQKRLCVRFRLVSIEALPGTAPLTQAQVAAAQNAEAELLTAASAKG